MKTILKLFSIIAIILLQSCDKDSSPCRNSETNIYYNIADSNKAKIPYTGTDTLVFISDQGDTATLVGQGKKNYYNTITENTSTVDCPKMENRNYENVEINFIGLTNKFEYQTIKFKVFTDVENSNKEAISIVYNNKPTYAALGPCNNELFYSSFYINNKTLLGIKIINLKSVPFDTTTTILYNSKLGILNILNNNTNWTKIK